MVAVQDKPFISIVIPTYNRPEILRECVISVISQSYKNWELIIIDDCSPSPIEAAIKDIIEKDSRIKFFRNIFRRTTPASRNIGITIARYDLIQFLEDDMVLDPNAISILIESYLKINENDKMLGAIAPSIPNIKYNDLKELDTVKERLMKEQVSPGDEPFKMSRLTGATATNFKPKYRDIREVQNVHACVLYPKKLLIEAKGFRENVYKGNFLREETDLSYRLEKSGYKFYFEPKSIFFHVRVSNGGSRVNVVAFIYYSIINHTKFLYHNFGIVKTIYMAPLFMLSTLSYYAVRFPGFLLKHLKKSLNRQV